MSKIQGKILLLIRKVGYDMDANSKKDCDGGENYYGVCIIKYCPEWKEGIEDPEEKRTARVSNTHYKVTTYINLEVPIFRIGVTIPITGETSSIHTDSGEWLCTNEYFDASGG